MSRRFFSAGLLLTSALVGPAALAQPNYPATVDVFGGVDGDGPGGGLELMAPFVEGEGSLLFGLARGTMWDETGAGGLGLGYRSQLLPGWILGGYGMVDYQRGRSDEGYFQGVLGLEALTESFDFRINGYLPEDDETALANIAGAAPPPPPPVTIGDLAVIDHEIGLVTGVTAGTAGFFRSFEQPLPGIDAEIGYRLPVPGHDFRIFLGAFHFEGGNDYENVTGPKARAEWRIHDLDLFGNNSRLTLEAGIRDDDVRGTDASAGLRIRIPFGGVPSNQRGHELAGLHQRMLDPIRREHHIVTGEREEAQAGTPSIVEIEAVKAVETGNEITSIWFADGAGGGDGTMGNETDLATAVSNPGAGDQQGRLIVALGGSGNLAGNVTMADDQILLGGASTLQVMGLTSGTMRTYAPGGARPTIVDASNAGNAAVLLADGNLLAGFDTRGTVVVTLGSINILGVGTDGLIARDLGAGVRGSGIHINGGSAISIDGLTFDGGTDPTVGGSAVSLNNVSNATLNDISFQNAGTGILVFNSTDVSISDVTSTNSLTAVDIQSSIDVAVDQVNATFTLPITSGSPIRAVAVRRAFAALPAPSDIDISNVTFTANTAHAVMRGVDVADASDVSVTTANVTNTAHGVVLVGVTGATVTDLTVTNAVGAAANFQSSSNVTLTGLDGSNVATGLFTFGGTNITVTDVDLTGVASSGATITNTTDLTVTGFTAVGLGTAPGSTRIGIQLSNASNVSFTDVDVSQFHRGIAASGGANHDFTDVTLDFVDTGVILSGVTDFGLTNATMTDVQGGVSVNAAGTAASQDVRLTNVDIAARAGIVGVSAGVQFLSADGATLTDVAIDGFAWGFRFFPAAGTVVQNVTGSNLTVTNITSQQGIQALNASNITIDGFTIDGGTGDGIFVGGTSNNMTLSNGTIGDIAGRGILVTGTGATGAAFSNIDISGISTSAGVFHSGAGVTLENNVTASFNQIDIDGQDSGGAMVGQYGFDFIDLLGQTQTVSGTGNTVVNVPNVCASMGFGTISGTVQINANPEPGTSC
jgi:parallel beta helix pectate lyase-like protein/inverse autotransporter-like protein with beta domain